jgi:F-type H+-transporting ATPase subunit b
VAGLGINLPVLITQLVSFLILFGALSFLAYKPILKMLDERSKKIKDSLEQAEAVRQQSTHAEEEVKKQLQIASQQGQEIIARASQAGEEVRKRAQDQAKQDAEVLLDRAKQEIQSERDEAIGELRSQFADLTILAAGKVIGESLDKETHRKLIDKVLQESQTLKKSQN